MAKSGPYMKNQRSFRKQKEKNYSAPLLFCSYHICNKNYPQDPSNDSNATTREQFNGDRQFAFIIYQRNIFSSFYLLRRVHKLHVFN